LCSYTFALADETASTGDAIALQIKRRSRRMTLLALRRLKKLQPRGRRAGSGTSGSTAAERLWFKADDIAVNQGVVAYWYAHGFANAFGHLRPSGLI